MRKMEKFDLKLHWHGFINNEIAVHCKSKESAQEFLAYCHKQRIKWYYEDGTLINESNWFVFKENTHYRCRSLGMQYVDIDSYLEENYIIVEFNGFN